MTQQRTTMEQSRTVSLNGNALNLEYSVISGQPLTFYSDYRKIGEREVLEYPTQVGVIRVSRHNAQSDVLSYEFFGNYSNASALREIKSRFTIDHNLQKVYSAINTDAFMDNAIRRFHGMKITQNPPWEATLCFLVSQFNNMKRIRLIINNLINKFGETITVDGKVVHLFPAPEALARASIPELMACGTGFRAKYIKSTALAFSKNPELNNLHDLDCAQLKARLMQLDGIGDKVADCILLFGYGKLESFPIDVWIKRVVESVYFKGRKKRIAQIHSFAEKRWGGNAGYAQQYLFWSGRESKTGVKA